MTTALDTNVLVALWNQNSLLNSSAKQILDFALSRGSLIISGPVFAELLAFPWRDERFVEYFLEQTGVSVDWTLRENVWRDAGRTFRIYAGRRRKQEGSSPRRILADFLIGAHALDRGASLATMDEEHYRTAFPKLDLITL